MERNRPRKSAFRYFLDDYWAQVKASGRKVTKKTATAECSRLWNDLDPERKQIYCDMANPMQNKVNKAGKVEPVPANMEYLDPVTGEYGERWLRYVRSGDELYYLKKKISDEKTLRAHKFYVVHCNYFCQTSYKKYVLAEIALVEFSFQEGIKNMFHTVVDPGEIPLGYAYEAKRLALEVHGIPPPPEGVGERDMKKIIDGIKNLVKFEDEAEQKYPPLFTVEENVLPAMHIINDFFPGTEEKPAFVVYPLQRMFFWLKKKCCELSGKGNSFNDEVVALKELEKDTFHYVLEIACEFHKSSESMFPACSLSIAQRLAFTICKHCCYHFNITLIGGRHVNLQFKRPAEDEDEASGLEDENCENYEIRVGNYDLSEEEYTLHEEDDDLREEDYGLRDEDYGIRKNTENPEQKAENAAGIVREAFQDEAASYPGASIGNRPIITTHNRRTATNRTPPNSGDVNRRYNFFLLNLSHGNVSVEPEDEPEYENILKTLDVGELNITEGPHLDPVCNGGQHSYPTVEEELAAYRRCENRRRRNLIIAEIKAREAREAREVLESNRGTVSWPELGELREGLEEKKSRLKECDAKSRLRVDEDKRFREPRKPADRRAKEPCAAEKPCGRETKGVKETRRARKGRKAETRKK